MYNLTGRFHNMPDLNTHFIRTFCQLFVSLLSFKLQHIFSKEKVSTHHAEKLQAWLQCLKCISKPWANMHTALDLFNLIIMHLAQHAVCCILQSSCLNKRIGHLTHNTTVLFNVVKSAYRHIKEICILVMYKKSIHCLNGFLICAFRCSHTNAKKWNLLQLVSCTATFIEFQNIKVILTFSYCWNTSIWNALQMNKRENKCQ